jgi:hypothetical protein
MISLRFIDLDTSFWAHLMPAQVLLGLGLGFTFVPLSNVALVGAGEHDAGAASAMLNATQQVGASIGTALLSTLSVTAITAAVTADQTLAGPAGPGPEAMTEGYTTAFAWGAALLLAGALVSAVLIKATKDDLPVDAGVAHVG